MHNYATAMTALNFRTNPPTPPSLDNREDRHAYLKKIITRFELRNQTDVVEYMTKGGFEVTQSSISRDFRELNVVKVAGIYRVAGNTLGSLESAIRMLITHTEPAGPNIFVIKTTPGGASAVAEAIDLEDINGVVGTVAGDNTIFIATKNKAAQTKVIERLKRL